MFTGVVFSTHLLLKDSQQKQIDDCLVLYAATVAQSKLNNLGRLLCRDRNDNDHDKSDNDNVDNVDLPGNNNYDEKY